MSTPRLRQLLRVIDGHFENLADPARRYPERATFHCKVSWGPRIRRRRGSVPCEVPDDVVWPCTRVEQRLPCVCGADGDDLAACCAACEDPGRRVLDNEAYSDPCSDSRATSVCAYYLQFVGSTPSRRALARYGSGRGLPFTTSLDVTRPRGGSGRAHRSRTRGAYVFVAAAAVSAALHLAPRI